MNFLAVPTAPATQGDPGSTQSLYLNPQNLTFPGVAIISGAVLNFLSANIGGNRLWLALAIAVVFGIIITVLALTDTTDVSRTSGRARFSAIAIGVVNTALLWISIFGISSIPAPPAA